MQPSLQFLQRAHPLVNTRLTLSLTFVRTHENVTDELYTGIEMKSRLNYACLYAKLKFYMTFRYELHDHTHASVDLVTLNFDP